MSPKEVSIIKKLLKSHKARFQIGIDLDGVVIDNTEVFRNVLGRWGWYLKPWQVNSNALERVLPGDVYARAKDAVYHRGRSKAPLMKGAIPALKAMSGRIVAVSVQKDAEAERGLLFWLKKHGVLNYIPRRDIYVVRRRERKLKLIRKLNPLLFIDDGLDVLEHLPQGIMPILFDPYGIRRHMTLNKKIKVLHGWKEAGKFLGY